MESERSESIPIIRREMEEKTHVNVYRTLFHLSLIDFWLSFLWRKAAFLVKMQSMLKMEDFIGVKDFQVLLRSFFFQKEQRKALKIKFERETYMV